MLVRRKSDRLLVGIFYERRICKILVIGVPLAIIMAGIGFVFDFFTLRVDVNEQAIHPSRWLVFILSAMAYSGMVLAAWWQYGKTTAHLINESTAQMAELVKLANVDALTGLPLLRLAADRLEMACIRAKRANSRAALFAIDLDGFKDINDTFGHEAGNHCLCEVARRLSACLRNTDTTARIGGDEFLVILDGVYEFEQVSTAAKQLIKEIALPMDFGGDQFAGSASIGIAIFPDHGTETDQLRQRADAAMYIAKRAGKNNFQFAALDWPVISSIKS